MTISKDNPIGVFDSGLGGLTVARELMRRLPHEHIVYFGDTARVPYGTKSKESIIRFSIENTKALLKYHIKMLVVACNSSSSYALPVLRKHFSIPIVDVIEPGARQALKESKNNSIGVIATQATVNSLSYLKAIKRLNRAAKVHMRPCPLFVPLVEEGWFNHKVTKLVAREYLDGLSKKGIDTLILGCTHYPLLKNILKEVLTPKVQLIDSAEAVARVVQDELNRHGLERVGKTKAQHRYLVSDRPQKFKELAKQFLGCEILNIKEI